MTRAEFIRQIVIKILPEDLLDLKPVDQLESIDDAGQVAHDIAKRLLANHPDFFDDTVLPGAPNDPLTVVVVPTPDTGSTTPTTP